MDSVAHPPLYTSDYQALSSTSKPAAPSSVPTPTRTPTPYDQSPLSRTTPTDSVIMAVVREGLDMLELEVADLISVSHSRGVSEPVLDSDTALCSMTLEDVAQVNNTLAMTREDPDSFGKEEAEVVRNMHTDTQVAYTLHAASTTYQIRTCTHCRQDTILVPEQLLADMQVKITDLALRGLQLVEEKNCALQKAKRTQRALAQFTKERDQLERALNGVSTSLCAAWWEVVALRSELGNTEARVKRLEKEKAQRDEEDVGMVQRGEQHEMKEVCAKLEAHEVEHATMAERITRITAQRNAESYHVGVLERALLICKEEIEARDSSLRETTCRFEQAEASRNRTARANCALRERIDLLEAENARLANIEADCQALVEMGEVCGLRDKRAEAWRALKLHDADRMREMEERNSYLEHRLELWEEEKTRIRTDATRSPGGLLDASRNLFTGRGLNLSSISLRKPKRRDDEEEGLSENTARR
ncbi:hypothetical protein OPT61_g5942 [Boeremia exigua]|uniref:Uncharacterized protein n=1 Tax=Boeremia exigua TaxID=749465 RepID=A0ACC2I8H1_9PLEO|nr:hypothetical protein OPT61_g5942 [Boeremia exigua]